MGSAERNPHGAAAGAPATRRACYACECPLGRAPAAARLISEAGALRAVELCSHCARGHRGELHRAREAEERLPSASVACGECGGPAPATSPAVASGGEIAVLCPGCARGERTRDDRKTAPQPPDPAPPSAPGRRTRRRAWLVAPLAASVAVLPPLGFALKGDDETDAEVPALLGSPLSGVRLAPSGEDADIRVPQHERPPVHALSYAGDDDGEVPLVWYHPLAGERRLPENPSRVFGAPRPGNRPSECEEGHCGVDLGHRRGPVIHAIRPALVDRIVRSSYGLSGKYLRLYHPEGFVSYYMHLDSIRADLVPGVEVAAGEPLGIMGATGIRNSPPHLHFAVAEILDDGRQQYVDPEPMLEQAVVLDEPAEYPDEWRDPAPRLARAEAHLGPATPRGGSQGAQDEPDGAELGEPDDDGELGEGSPASDRGGDDPSEPESEGGGESSAPAEETKAPATGTAGREQEGAASGDGEPDGTADGTADGTPDGEPADSGKDERQREASGGETMSAAEAPFAGAEASGRRTR